MDISGCFQLTGKALTHLSNSCNNIQHINLSYLPKVPSKYLQKFIESCSSTLQHLEMDNRYLSSIPLEKKQKNISSESSHSTMDKLKEEKVFAKDVIHLLASFLVLPNSNNTIRAKKDSNSNINNNSNNVESGSGSALLDLSIGWNHKNRIESLRRRYLYYHSNYQILPTRFYSSSYSLIRTPRYSIDLLFLLL